MIKLTAYPDNFFTELDYSYSASLQAEYSEGDVVEVDGDKGVITSLMTESFEFPVGDDALEQIEASSDEPAYVVALVSGGSVAVTEDELEESSFDEEVDPQDLAGEAEMAFIYAEMDDPNSMEELINIRGVDDPGVGFDELPDGWDRASVLQAWASLGGTFTSCRADMMGEIRSPTRFCAALKDETLQTEMWRNRF